MSWEDYVDRVCVNGRPDEIAGLDGQWGTLFSKARTVAESLRDGIKDLKKHWSGPAAEDYFAKLEQIAKTIDDFEANNSLVRDMLAKAQKALTDAQTGMPIPEFMLDEVQNLRGSADRLKLMNSIPAMMLGGLIKPGTFAATYNNSFLNGVGNVLRETAGHPAEWIDDWIHHYGTTAEQHYNDLNLAYSQTAAWAPEPTPSSTGITNGYTAPPGGGGLPGGGGGPGVSGLGAGAPPPSSFDPSTLGNGVGAYDPANASGYDPNANPLGGSLAGVGSGGLGDIGPGGTGLGGLGGGLGGLDPSGIGAGSVGRPVPGPSLPMGLGGMPGMAGNAAGRGMVGGPAHGGGAHAPEDEHGTWLTEDEDPWGGDTDAPPSLLG